MKNIITIKKMKNLDPRGPELPWAPPRSVPDNIVHFVCCVCVFPSFFFWEGGGGEVLIYTYLVCWVRWSRKLAIWGLDVELGVSSYYCSSNYRQLCALQGDSIPVTFVVLHICVLNLTSDLSYPHYLPTFGRKKKKRQL